MEPFSKDNVPVIRGIQDKSYVRYPNISFEQNSTLFIIVYVVYVQWMCQLFRVTRIDSPLQLF